jgi:hypothetical protein
MDAVVFSFNPPKPDGSLANTRTAQFVAKELGLPLVCGPEIADHQNLDVLFMVAGVFMYCRVLPQVAKCIETAKRVVWIQNDYTIQPPKDDGDAESPFRKAFRTRRANGLPPTDFWTTMKAAADRTEFSAYLNWNCMAYEGITDEQFQSSWEAKYPTVFYYGADRAGRQIYFDRFFRGQAAPLIIGSFSRSMGRYDVDADVISAFPRRQFFDNLGRYQMGLYLEDRKSHKEFTSPATRFYEMLSVGMAMVFQEEAVPMLAEAGYNVAPYVATPETLVDLLQSARSIAEEQRAQWAGTAGTAGLLRAMHNEFDRLKETSCALTTCSLG